ncbi:NAD(P)-binding protein [Aspergillus unguis]
MKVAIVGATGETGSSVVNGLLAADHAFEITALIRPSSLEKPATADLKARGVKIVPADLEASGDKLVGILKGIDVVISTIHYQSLSQEIPLANAAKAAGVKRYVPCFWATIAPRGIMRLRDEKELILDHVQRLQLPYTAIDVGWWFQICLPRIPSGKFDYGLLAPANTIYGDGNVPSSLTDVRDVGMYAAKIITDPRTLNKRVFAYTEARTQNELFDLVEKVTGERPEAAHVSVDEVRANVAKCREAGGNLDQAQAQYEYYNSWGVRGDNTVESAKYLGYLILDELYPGLKGRSLESYIKEVLDGKAAKAYT